ncbi:uncharacterized protein LOC143863338 [Tasmannia lanceolata]|uniref:uncharacterized protein LOC143863338 n=1 Tax=Tasmannia lanceolata TaxID=3420 RepID=UPI004063FE6F
MAVSKGRPMFLKAIDCSEKTKDKHFIANLLKEVINEVGHDKVVQVVIDNAPNCKAAGQSCFEEHLCGKECGSKSNCLWIILKLLSVAETRFASVFVMLKRFKLLKQGLQLMVISDKWNCYREDDVGKAKFVKEKVLDDIWWDSIDHIFSFTSLMYYSEEWLSAGSNSVPPLKDTEIYAERVKCLQRYFLNSADCTKANVEFAHFSMKFGLFNDRATLEPHDWWVVHGTCAPMLQSLALKFLMQPSSSSCAQRNLSTYSFVHSLRRNKITPQRAQDLVFVHSNLRLLSRRSPQYVQGETKMWDIGGDSFDSFEDVGVLEVASLSLDEQDLEVVVFTDDVEDDIGDEATGIVSNE